jgi:ubiquinone/menaquinone biosynthesis C-methylase UbiE
MTSSAPRPETIEKLASAVYPSFAMLAGMQLDLFTPIKDGPMSAEQLAAALGVRADKLQPLLYALVAAGLLTVEGEMFANTREADHFLVRGKPAYMGGRHQTISEQWEAVLKTSETIRTGSPAGRLDFSTISPGESESLARARRTDSTTAARDLVARCDFSTYHDLLDVGGGAGYLSIAVTEACPHLRATVVDLAPATAVARRVVAEMGASDRVQVVTADVVGGPLPGAFDVAVMRNFIQVLSVQQARRAIHNVGQVIQPEGLVYILGSVLDNSRLSPLEIVGHNLYYLNVFDEGQAYTEQEHRDWLTEAGFVDFKRVVLPNSRSIVTARKPK